MSNPINGANLSPENLGSISVNDEPSVRSSALEAIYASAAAPEAMRSLPESRAVSVQTKASLEKDRILVEFYKYFTMNRFVPFAPMLEGSISNQAKAIQTWVACGMPSSFQSLDARGKGLTVLPPEVGNFNGLILLNLSGNDLLELPEAIGNCSSLAALYANNNSLIELPKSIGNLKNLIEIDVSDNCLLEIPVEITLLSKLEHLLLNKNYLTTLPPGMGCLQSLLTINLDENFGAAITPFLQEKIFERGEKLALQEAQLGNARTEEIRRKELEFQQMWDSIGPFSVPQQSGASSSNHHRSGRPNNGQATVKCIVELSDDEEEKKTVELSDSD